MGNGNKNGGLGIQADKDNLFCRIFYSTNPARPTDVYAFFSKYWSYSLINVETITETTSSATLATLTVTAS